MTENRELTLLQRMKSQIEKQESAIKEYEAIIDQLTSIPADYGIILQTGNKTAMPRRTVEKDFVKGTAVFIKPTAIDKYDVLHPNGKIQKVDSNGIANVRMVEQKNVLVSISDLELCVRKTEDVETVTAMIAGSVVEVVKPQNIELKAGESVIVSKMSSAIIRKAPATVMGTTAAVKESPKDGFCEIVDGVGTRMVFCGGFTDIEKGDHIVLDPSGTVIVKNNKKATTDYTAPKLNVLWDSIGGLPEVKEQVYEMVELPHKKPEVFKYYNKKPAKGLLLYGPPGCGKTMIAKAIATSLAAVYNADLTENGFIYIKGPEILNKYVGQSEETIRELFDRARRHKLKTGYPATMFIDEADAILSERGSGISSDVDKTIVPMFLTEMDGLEDSSAFVILATNRADRLDPAVVREGRIDVKIEIPRPDQEACRKIAEINLKGTKVHGDSVEDLARILSEMLFESSLRKEVSGALVAGAVEAAIMKAIRRDLKSKEKSGTGVSREDIVEALLEMDSRHKTSRTKQEDKIYDNAR